MTMMIMERRIMGKRVLMKYNMKMLSISKMLSIK